MIRLKSTSDIVLAAQEAVLGLYQLTTGVFQDFPVYKKLDGNQFLFVSLGGLWTVHSETHDTEATLQSTVQSGKFVCTTQGNELDLRHGRAPRSSDRCICVLH